MSEWFQGVEFGKNTKKIREMKIGAIEIEIN